MNKKQVVTSLLLLAALLLGCKMSKETNSNRSSNTNGNAAKSTDEPSKVNEDGTIASRSGTEKEKPEPGKGNVQGRVLYNEKPVAEIEVKLCEKFNQFIGGCGGQTFITKTDQNGEYLIKNVTPRIYEGLLVKVFDSNYYVFATSGIVQTAKYKINADETFFAPDTTLFKSDLKLVSPKASAKVAANNIEFKWDPYPDAAYYKLSVYADSGSGAQPEYDFIGRKVEGESFTTDKPLTPGTYSIKLEAFNANEVKLAESSRDNKFTVQ
ncbi:MAG TPA: hypothetical protein VFD63_06475 [Pyrinomonadaceae bacterium]|jgi:hypothetical protein|nr:hypothetical protein [Pyrinomonadaceae bacterium]